MKCHAKTIIETNENKMKMKDQIGLPFKNIEIKINILKIRRQNEPKLKEVRGFLKKKKNMRIKIVFKSIIY